MSSPPVVPDHLLDIARAVLPSADLSAARLAQGQFHEVVLLPGVAAVRVARREAAGAQLQRRTDLLRRLGQVGLPFRVPEPLSDALVIGGRVAAAVSWLPGRPLGERPADPQKLRALLTALEEVRLDELAGLLDRPHAYAGGDDWLCLQLEEVIPALPSRHRAEATRRVGAAAALPEQAPSLVHGDLGGDNVHWDDSGNLVGVLDWDLAQPFDQAVDVACLAQHGWDVVGQAVSPSALERARVWWRIFPLEQVAAAIVNREPPEVLDKFLAGTVDRLDAEALG